LWDRVIVWFDRHLPATPALSRNIKDRLPITSPDGTTQALAEYMFVNGERTSGASGQRTVNHEARHTSATALRRIGQGREAEIFDCGDRRALKLLRAPGPNSGLTREIAALDAAGSAGVPVPRTYEMVEIDGRSGLVMDRLDGPDLLTMIGRKPWLVFYSGRITGELHARINATSAPVSLPTVRDAVTRGLARLSRSESMLAGWVGEIFAKLPDGDALCHGDFHPGQIMRSGDRFAAFDWSAAKRGHPLFDYARTRVLLSMGEPPPGTSLALRLLAKIGRGILLSSYARAYARQSATEIDDRLIAQWEIVNLAVRIDEVAGERPRLLDRLYKERALART
jgi:aminoglycoside phosphotransferase (APT) family kinase protein